MPERGEWRGTPQDWLARAKGDLALATVSLPDHGFYEDLCYHAQQAAEKAIKAIYVRFGWEFQYTHDLTKLLRALERSGVEVPASVRSAIDLTLYAYQARYPERGHPVDAAEHQRATRLAAAVLVWAEDTIDKAV